LATISFGILLLGQVDSPCSDSFGTLVVAQSIVKSDTVRLDKYQDLFRRENGYYNEVVHWRGRPFYNYFPLDGPVLSVSVVALANLAGLDMRTYDNGGQRVLSAATGALITGLARAGLFFSIAA
jgi:hypothetical protein